MESGGAAMSETSLKGPTVGSTAAEASSTGGARDRKAWPSLGAGGYGDDVETAVGIAFGIGWSGPASDWQKS